MPPGIRFWGQYIESSSWVLYFGFVLHVTLVIFESDYKRIRLPKPFMLNERGFARVLIGIYPPSLKNPEFKGLITIRAFMDGIGFDDVAEGHLVLKILNLGQKRTLLIDPDEGVSKKQN